MRCNAAEAQLTPPSRPMQCSAHMAGLGGDGFKLIADAWMVKCRNQRERTSGPIVNASDTYRARSENGEVPVRRPLRAWMTVVLSTGPRLAHERFGRLAWDELFNEPFSMLAKACP